MRQLAWRAGLGILLACLALWLVFPRWPANAAPTSPAGDDLFYLTSPQAPSGRGAVSARTIPSEA